MRKIQVGKHVGKRRVEPNQQYIQAGRHGKIIY